MTSRRKLGTLTRADIGKRITFICECSRPRRVEGVIRAFTHGVFSHESAGEIDVPRVMVSVYAIRSHDTHWGTPETVATLAADVESTKEGKT